MTPHSDEQAREWLIARGKAMPYWEEEAKALAALLDRVRQQTLEEAEFAFKAAYAEYEDPLIGVMLGLKAIINLRQAAGEETK